MKETIKIALRQLIFSCSKLICKVLAFKKENKAVVLVPSWEGSIGDEAVIDSITNALKQDGIGTTLLHFGNKNEWEALQSIDRRYNIPKYFKTGGWSDHIKLIGLFSKHKYFYALGTDMLDGCYAEWLTLGLLRLTEQAAKSGLKTNVVGFSINTWQNKNCIAALGNLPEQVKLCVRDDVSKNRLQLLLPNRDLTLTADMAFLLQPQKSSKIIDDLETWILKQKKNQKLVIGINISPQLFDDEQKTNAFIELFHKTLVQLEESHQSKFAFVLISHDLRPYNSDITILTDLYEKCIKNLKSEVFLIEERIMASEIKYIAGLLDLVITGRMHLSIASLGQGTPIGCMVYQGKFEGLFNHFNMPDTYLIDPKEAIKESNLLNFVTLIINERHAIKGVIDHNLKHVKELSKANLS